MTVAETRDKVQRILTKNLNAVQIDEDGDYRIRYGSTACFISVSDWGDGDTLVKLNALILSDIPTNPEVYRWAATEGQNYFFGSTAVIEQGQGTLGLLFSHTLLGTYLDEGELMTALGGIVTTADKLDDELKGRFGGRRLVEN